MPTADIIFDDRPCDLCGLKDEDVLFSRPGVLTGHLFQVIRCRQCGFLYVNPRLRPADLAALYDQGYYSGRGFDRGVDFHGHGQAPPAGARWSLQIIQELCPAPAHLLDYGGGLGQLARLANENGYAADCFEVSSAAPAVAAQTGLHFFHSEGDIPDNAYDLVSAIEVMEHVYSPTETLQTIRRVLKPGGIFYFQTGNFDSFYKEWQGGARTPALDSYILPEGHVNFFSTPVMEKFFRKAGFSSTFAFKRRNYNKTGGLFRGFPPCASSIRPKTARKMPSRKSSTTAPESFSTWFTARKSFCLSPENSAPGRPEAPRIVEKLSTTPTASGLRLHYFCGISTLIAMRLKRLEMVGFKSFADRTRVEFEPGITAVVGPNGCGKSNIADAVRWSLGEMSPKSLRSQQMLDVIFNGTATRAPQGMSEVSLTFDNTSHQIPLDYTEVTVARRLFRSGESEYFINKTQCRLKDVRDLFLDTGVGNDGYYVMAQGKIEFLLSAKPEERRELFEEAAGVSKYKVRREEALRRLGKVEQDMLRLNDSLAIYKQQMDALEAAVRKAKQHQKLQDELKRLEIASLLRGFLKAQSDWEQIHLKQEEEAGRLNAMREDVSAREKALSDARLGAEASEEDVLTLQREIAQYETDWAKAEAERVGAQEREIELKTVQERLGQESGQLGKLLEEWRQTLSGLQGEIGALRLQFHEKNQAFKQEDDRARHEQLELLNLQKGLEQSKARLLELVRLLSHHRNETVRLTSLTVRHEEASKSKERELEKIRLRRGALEEQIASQEKQAVDTQAKLETVQNTLRAIDDLQRQDRAALSGLEHSIQDGRERLARLEAEKLSLERWLSQDPVALAAGYLRQASLPGIHGPVRELLRTSGPYQRLLDRALGDRAHYFVADSLNDAQSAVRFLSDERKGWATFLVLDRLAQTDQLLALSETMGSRSLAEAVECDEKFRPVLHLLLGRTFYVGETLFEEGILRGGADPEMESYQATPSDLGRLVQELSELSARLAADAADRARLNAAANERDAERLPIAEDQNKIHVLCQVQQESLSRLKDDRQMSQTEETLLDHEKEEAIRAIAQTQEALQQEEILLTTLEEEEKSLQDSFQAQDAALVERRQAVERRLAHVSELRVASETMRERLLGKEREVENAQSRLDAFEDRSKQIQAETLETAGRLTQLAQIQVDKAQMLITLGAAKERQSEKLAQLLAQRQDLQARLHAQDEELAACRESLAQAQAQAQEAEIQARMLDQERARLELALRETYQLSMDEARASHGEVTPDAEELARIKRRLEGMGAVNLAAPEEHAQLEERFQFLLTQQQDLLKAKDDLHQAIAKINATTREQFRATFDQVRTNFRALFQTLFQGGESDLVLTDEHNLLETGIDIFAQPPGKKLQNITLLSGGEKALTAIAVLFAFFMVKPSPFCLLDEVDAPLDEANVGRFIKMVQEFAEKTQFIVITHNKRTMEMADVLYGVTMAQLGVSSLISMKLESSSKNPEPVAA